MDVLSRILTKNNKTITYAFFLFILNILKVLSLIPIMVLIFYIYLYFLIYLQHTTNLALGLNDTFYKYINMCFHVTYVNLSNPLFL